MSTVNAGKQVLLELSEDDGTTWLSVGGIQTKGLNFDNPAIDATNQSTFSIRGSDFTESVFNGFSTVTLSGDGVMDRSVDAATVSAYTMLEIATSSTRTGLFRITDGTTSGSITVEGLFIVTSFELGGEIQGLETFSISMQSAEGVTTTVTKPTVTP